MNIGFCSGLLLGIVRGLEGRTGDGVSQPKEVLPGGGLIGKGPIGKAVPKLLKDTSTKPPDTYLLRDRFDALAAATVTNAMSDELIGSGCGPVFSDPRSNRTDAMTNHQVFNFARSIDLFKTSEIGIRRRGAVPIQLVIPNLVRDRLILIAR